MDASQKEKEVMQSRINALSLDLEKKKKEDEKLQKEITEMKREKDKILANMQKHEGEQEGKVKAVSGRSTQAERSHRTYFSHLCFFSQHRKAAGHH